MSVVVAVWIGIVVVFVTAEDIRSNSGAAAAAAAALMNKEHPGAAAVNG